MVPSSPTINNQFGGLFEKVKDPDPPAPKSLASLYLAKFAVYWRLCRQFWGVLSVFDGHNERGKRRAGGHSSGKPAQARWHWDGSLNHVSRRMGQR